MPNYSVGPAKPMRTFIAIRVPTLLIVATIIGVTLTVVSEVLYCCVRSLAEVMERPCQLLLPQRGAKVSHLGSAV